MKDLYYENQGTTTYLVYKIKENDQIDTMTLGMLTNNKIPGLVPTTFTQMDKDKYIKFNVSAKVSASQFLSGTVNGSSCLECFGESRRLWWPQKIICWIRMTFA